MAGQQREKIEGTRGRLLGYKDGGMGDYSLYIHSTNLLDGAACEGRVCHILSLVLENSGKKQLDHRKKKLQLQLLSVIFLYIYIVFYYDLIIMIEYNILYLVGESRAPYPLPTNSNILNILRN